jgi:hypothetical protein
MKKMKKIRFKAERGGFLWPTFVLTALHLQKGFYLFDFGKFEISFTRKLRLGWVRLFLVRLSYSGELRIGLVYGRLGCVLIGLSNVRLHNGLLCYDRLG